MAYDRDLAARLRTALEGTEGVTEMEMFGGLGFMVDGNMCCGVIDERLMARIGPEAYEGALEERHVTPMDFTGRPMRGFVYVEPAGLETAVELQEWVDRALEFVGTLPPKS